MKFHPLTRQEWVDEYREWAATKKDVLFIDKGENVTKYQLMADTLISDTSSTIYEFLLLSPSHHPRHHIQGYLLGKHHGT